VPSKADSPSKPADDGYTLSYAPSTKTVSKPADDGYTPSYAPSMKTVSKPQEPYVPSYVQPKKPAESATVVGRAAASNPSTSRAGDESEPDDYGIYNDYDDEDSASGSPLRSLNPSPIGAAKKEPKSSSSAWGSAAPPPAKSSWDTAKTSSAAPAPSSSSWAKGAAASPEPAKTTAAAPTHDESETYHDDEFETEDWEA